MKNRIISTGKRIQLVFVLILVLDSDWWTRPNTWKRPLIGRLFQKNRFASLLLSTCNLRKTLLFAWNHELSTVVFLQQFTRVIYQQRMGHRWIRERWMFWHFGRGQLPGTCGSHRQHGVSSSRSTGNRSHLSFGSDTHISFFLKF